MEALTELGIALFAAAVLISLFAILRLATRSPSSPSWLSSLMLAYIFAVPFTIGIAASLVYLGFALAAFMNGGFAGLASIGIHLGLLAIFRTLLPVSDIAPVTHEARKSADKIEAVLA